LRPVLKKSQFLLAANDLANKLKDLNDFIKSSQATYLSPGLSNIRDKKAIEDEVELRVAACSQIVEILKQSTLAAVKRGDTLISSYSKDQKDVMSSLKINGHFEAHLHGIALIFALKIGKVAASFDRIRASKDEQDAAAAFARNQQLSKVEGIWLASGKAHISPVSSSFPPPPPMPSQATQESSNYGIKLQSSKTDSNELLRLLTMAQGVPHVESRARELATLSRILASASIEQAEHIETLYDNALETTANLEAGNISLRQARKVRTSSTQLVIVVILVLTLCLVFLDWFEG